MLAVVKGTSGATEMRGDLGGLRISIPIFIACEQISLAITKQKTGEDLPILTRPTLHRQYDLRLESLVSTEMVWVARNVIEPSPSPSLPLCRYTR